MQGGLAFSLQWPGRNSEVASGPQAQHAVTYIASGDTTGRCILTCRGARRGFGRRDERFLVFDVHRDFADGIEGSRSKLLSCNEEWVRRMKGKIARLA
jgi:hypothetical protein